MNGMETKASSMTETNNSASNDIVIERIIDAPRRLVWQAWTNPVHLARWWGPEHFTSPVGHVDLRVGGKYHFCMRSPDGQEFWSTGFYRELEPYNRLVMTDSFSDPNGNIVPASYYGMAGDIPLEMLVTVVLEERDGKTHMIVRHSGIPAGEMKDLTALGLNTSLDKLIASLNDKQYTIVEPGKQEIIMLRTFDAQRDLVFRAFTDPQVVARWWGVGNTAIDTMEARPGGRWRYVETADDGSQYAFHGVYHEVAAPERLVYTFEFEGIPGHVLMETIIFQALDDNRTRIIDQAVYQSVEDRDGMLQEGMEEGANASMDKLERLLASL
jgi:uncharacterized protein YndB with AHSA1/START domain